MCRHFSIEGERATFAPFTSASLWAELIARLCRIMLIQIGELLLDELVREQGLEVMLAALDVVVEVL